jgi:predicted transcriptional regulator
MSPIGNEIQQMLDDVRKEAYLEPLDVENDMTKERLSESLNVTKQTAAYMAEKMIASGKWTKVYRSTSAGKKVAVYRKV